MLHKYDLYHSEYNFTILILYCIFFSLLLHAKVEEYSQCYAIASIWLKDVENLTNPNYVLLVEIYITNVLLPRGQDNLIDPFIDSCPGLTSEQRKTLHNNYINKKVILPGSDEKNQNIDRDMERETTHKKPPTLVKGTVIVKEPIHQFNLYYKTMYY